MPGRREKVCPIVLRRRAGQWQWLVFQHPRAGVQLIKGGRMAGERVCTGALRELYEETGLRAASPHRVVSSQEVMAGETWHFIRCRPLGRVPDRWRWFTCDGGGLWFEPFWQNIDVSLPGRYGRAAAILRKALDI